MHEVTVELLDVVVSIKMYMDHAGAEEGGEGGEGGDGGEGGEGGEEGQDEYGVDNRKSALQSRAKQNYYLEFVGWR